jgi:hypothetical protein
VGGIQVGCPSGVLLDLVGHRVKIHKITTVTCNTTGKERGDIEIRDYVVLPKPQEQTIRLSPPHTLILDFTMTHTRYGRSIQHTTGQVTHTRRSDGDPERDGDLQKMDREPGTKYGTIVKFTSIDQIQSRSCP